MKTIRYIISFTIIISIQSYSQISERVLKPYNSFTQKYLDYLGIENPFSYKPACRATVTKQRNENEFYMIAFVVDQYKNTIIYGDVGRGSSSWSKYYGGYGSGNGQFKNPIGAAADKFGNLYVADSGNNRIVKLYCNFETGEMIFVKNIYNNFNGPSDVVISNNNTDDLQDDDKIWVADCNNNKIVELDNLDNIVRTIGSFGNGVMQFNKPTTVKVFDYGENGVEKLLIGDAGNHRIIMMSTNGEWYDNQLSSNDEISSIDYFDDEIYVLEKYSGTVHKYRWPNIYLANFNGTSASNPNSFSFPISISIPFPKVMPYICVFEQWNENTGCKLFVQGVDLQKFENISNIDGSVVQYQYLLPTNSIISEKIIDKEGNVIKNLNDSILVDSNPVISGTWYGEDNNGQRVPPGEYFLKSNITSKWESNETNLLKRTINRILRTDKSGNSIDQYEVKASINIPTTKIIISSDLNSQDNTLYKDVNSWNYYISDTNYGNENSITIGTTIYTTKRSLLKFSLINQFKQNDKVIDASILLKLKSKSNTGNRIISVYKILTPWDESASCWNRPNIGGLQWNGCSPDDRFALKIASSSLTVNNQTGWYEWSGNGLIDLIQDWITNPATNYGILLKLENDNPSENHEFTFYSSEEIDTTSTPRLEVVYEKYKHFPEFKTQIVAYPKIGPAPLSVKFDASNSYSPSGIESYSWDFDSSDGITTNSNKITENIIYRYPGKYFTTLNTKDSANVNGVDTLSIYIYGSQADTLKQNTTWSGNFTLNKNYLVPSGVTLTVQSNARISLNGYYVRSIGGVINRQNSVTFIPEIKSKYGNIITGQFPTVQSSIENTVDGNTIYLEGIGYNENLIIRNGIKLLGTKMGRTYINGTVYINGAYQATIKNMDIKNELRINSSVVSLDSINHFGNIMFNFSIGYLYNVYCGWNAKKYIDVFASYISGHYINNDFINIGINGHGNSIINFNYACITGKHYAVYLDDYSSSVLRGLYFCQNQYDVYANANSYANGYYVDKWSGTPSTKIYGNVIYNTNSWLTCGMGKENNKENIEVKFNYDDDKGIIEYLDAMKNYNEIHDKKKDYMVNNKKHDNTNYKSNYDIIISKLKKIITNYPENNSAIYALTLYSRCCIELDDTDSTITYYNDMLADKKYNFMKLSLLKEIVNIKIFNKKYNEAIDKIEEIQNKYHDDEINAFLLYQKAYIYKYCYEDTIKAVEIYKEIIRRYPENSFAFSSRVEMGEDEFKDNPEFFKRSEMPSEFTIASYPNPFNNVVKIVFNIPQTDKVKIRIYDLRGRLTKTLMDCYQNRGKHFVIWNGKDKNEEMVTSGVYIYQITYKDKTLSKKLVLVK